MSLGLFVLSGLATESLDLAVSLFQTIDRRHGRSSIEVRSLPCHGLMLKNFWNEATKIISINMYYSRTPLI